MKREMTAVSTEVSLPGGGKNTFGEEVRHALAGCAVALVVLALASLAHGAEYSLITNDFDADAAVRAAGLSLPGNFPPSRRSRPVTLTPLIAIEKGVTRGDTLTLNLFPDKVYTARIDGVATNVNGTVAVRGRIEGYSFGYVLISTTWDRSLGSVRVPEKGEHYIIQSEPHNKIHYLIDVNVDQLEELEDGPTPIPPPPTPQEAAEMEMLTATLAGGPLDPATIDVMVVYTPAARQWADSYGGGMANVISQAMGKAQLALDNSNTILTMNLVYSVEVSYTESGSSNTDLNRLTSTSDGYMDEVHTWRNQYGADLVGLFTYVEDTGGLGWLLNTTSGLPQYGFSLTRVQQAGWTYTHIHEMGHNMGCHHHKQQNVQPGPGLFSYSAGWRWIGNDSGRYCSVMTYADGQYFPDGQTHTQVAYFSNPSILYKGVATGDAADGDNARTIRETKQVIAAYRQSYTLSLSKTGSGSIKVNGTPYSLPWSGTFTDGSNVTLEAVPDSGWQFSSWTGDLSGNSDPTSVLMDGNKSITANFQFLYSGGTGEPNDPYRIATPEDLNDIGRYEEDLDKHFILVNDIDLAEFTSTQFNRIGTDWDSAFTGVFDGNDHKIWHFAWTSDGIDYVGLFGYVGDSGQIKNLGMENVDVNAIYVCSEPEHCTSSSCIGGLVGLNSGTITNCYSTGSVSGDDYSNCVGGLVGDNSGTITNCYSTASTSGGYAGAGGLAGDNYGGEITNCYSTGSVSGRYCVGGLAGENDEGTITNCYSTGSVTGTGEYVGGLVGSNGGVVTASFWDVNTSGQSTSADGTPKTTAEMKTKTTFTTAGWDFVNIWDICEGTNYPRLRWQIQLARAGGDFLCPYGIDFADLAILASAWQTKPTDTGWNPACDISKPKDNFIDELDLAILCENWLEGTTP